MKYIKQLIHRPLLHRKLLKIQKRSEVYLNCEKLHFFQIVTGVSKLGIFRTISGIYLLTTSVWQEKHLKQNLPDFSFKMC